MFEPVRDGDGVFRVNLGPSLATAAHVQALFDAKGVGARSYRTGVGEGDSPAATTILLFDAADLAVVTALLADVADDL